VWRALPGEERDEPDEDLASWRPADWRAARRGGALALMAVVMVPLLHQLTTIAGSRDPALLALRARVAASGTLLVGALYLARQLHMLRRIARNQRLREERFRALVEHSADTIGVAGADGLLSNVSASSERVTGYRPDELLGRSPLELLPEPDREPLRRVLSEVAAHPGGRARGTVRLMRRDGSTREGALATVNLLATPAVRGVVLHLRDVSEARRVEQESTRSLSLLEATLEATADGILVARPDGRVERVNQRLAEMWRLPPGSQPAGGGEAVATVVERELLQPEVFALRLHELQGDPEAESFDALRLRGGRVLECRSLPQRLAGEVVGRVFSFRDVTERAHAEQATARLAAIVEATPDLVATCDARLALRYMNRAGRLMLGARAASAREEPLLLADLYAAGARERLLAEALPTALREGVWRGETRLRHFDGGELPVLQVLLAHRGPDGEVDFVSTIARDLRQRLDAEAALRRSHTMAALGALVAGVTHEVRNPLFAISSTLDAFEARFAGQQVPDRYVRVLRAQLERLTGLMRDLLEYANPPGLELSEGRFESVVAAALAACAALQQRTSVAIESRLDPGLPPLCMDERRLVQVLQNLLQNALQHSPVRGRVRLEARAVCSASGPAIECSIDDEGPGVPERDLARLFEPFFTRRTGGTGLGLSIVQRIVSDHGGTVAAANRPEGGARFTVRLPATERRP
jgi:PAS domain S-box-containing protein